MLNGLFGEWAILGAVITAALALDMAVFRRRFRQVNRKSAVIESAAWIALSLTFSIWIYVSRGQQASLQFLTGYLIEKSLSIDNLLIFVVIFRSLRVPPQSQHKVLFYGVAGALVMRAVFVFAGVELLKLLHVVVFFFGAILLITAIQMILPRKEEVRLERNWLVRLTRRFVPVVNEYEGDAFWVKIANKRFATPLLITLIAVEAMDVILAVDSVPAVLAISRDTFIVYSSNAFAVLGLRALYFAVADLLQRLRFLHQGLAAILIFVALKMVAPEWIGISDAECLGVVAAILAVTALASVAIPRTPESTANSK